MLWRASDSSRIECHRDAQLRCRSVAASTTTNSCCGRNPNPISAAATASPACPAPTMIARRCVNPDRITTPSPHKRAGAGTDGG